MGGTARRWKLAPRRFYSRAGTQDRLDLKEVPEEERGRYNTLSGMVMLLVEDCPRPRTVANGRDGASKVMDMDGKRIDKVLATPISPRPWRYPSTG